MTSPNIIAPSTGILKHLKIHFYQIFVSEFMTIISKFVYTISFIIATYPCSPTCSLMRPSCVRWYCFKDALIKAVCLPNLVYCPRYVVMMTSSCCFDNICIFDHLLQILRKKQAHYCFLHQAFFFSRKPNTQSLF